MLPLTDSLVSIFCHSFIAEKSPDYLEQADKVMYAGAGLVINLHLLFKFPFYLLLRQAAPSGYA